MLFFIERVYLFVEVFKYSVLFPLVVVFMSCDSLIWLDSPALPDSGGLEVTRGIKLLQLVGWSGPPQTVVSVTGKASVWHRQSEAERGDHAGVGDAVEGDQTLGEHYHGS